MITPTNEPTTSPRRVTGPPRSAFVYDVVIPTHGRRPEFLQQALDSVMRQTLPPNQVIVVVDGNPAFAAKLRLSDSRISVRNVPAGSGASGGRQVGILASTAPWIAFLDDDDLWLPIKQEQTATYLTYHPEAQAVRAGYWMFAAPGAPMTGLNGQTVELRGTTLAELEAAAASEEPLNDLSYLDILGDSLALMLEFNRGVTSTTVVRRDILTRCPPVPIGLRPGNDYMLFTHVAALTEWHLIEQRLALYRVHAKQETQQPKPDGARNILRAKRLLWDAYGAQTPRPISDYGAIYSAEVRESLWQLVKGGHPQEALRTYCYSLPLLPKISARVLALIPDPVVWHAARLGSRFLAHSEESHETTPEW